MPRPRPAARLPCLARALLALGLLVAAMAATAMPLPETPQFRRLGVEQGLPSSRVNGLAQDRAGYLWIATDDGIARYDGVGMRIWRYDPGIVDGMPGNLVNALHVDARDDVWMAVSDRGIARIDRHREAVLPLRDPALPQLETIDVWSIAETGDGRLWFASFGEGLLRREPDGSLHLVGAVPTGAAARPVPRLISLLADAGEGLWIGTVSGLAYWNGETLEAVAAGELDEAAIIAMDRDPDGSLWLSTRSHGLWRRSPEGRFERSPWNAGIGGARPFGVKADGSGGHWIHTARGLFLADASGLRRLPAPEGSEGNFQQMLVDRQGGLWFGDADHGLAWLSPGWRSFASLSRSGEPPLRLSMRQALAFAALPDGGLLIGGEEGLLDRLDADRRRVTPRLLPPSQFAGERLTALLALPDGTLWVGASRLLLRRDPAGRWTRWGAEGPDAAPAAAIDFLVPMPDGTLWVAAYGAGLQQRAADGRVLRRVQPEDGLGLETLHVEHALAGPDGALWVANAQGVLRWDGARFERLVDAEGGPVFGIAFESPEAFWTYRTGLLQQWRRDGGRWKEASRADAANEGMPAVDAGGLVRDAHGRLWIFSLRGLVRFDPATRGLRLFGPADGLREREFGLRPPLVLPDGRVVAGTANGAVLFDPLTVAADGRVPPLVIDTLSVRRAEDVVALDPDAPVRLEASDRDLRIVARLMSFADPGAHRFRFRLHGYDPDWVEVGAAGERQLPRQLPGRYRLEVRAAGADGRWGETRLIEYEVLPPWWLSPRALVAYAVLLLGLAAGGVLLVRHRLRLRARERQEREARRLALEASEAKSRFLADLGHELRTPLTGVLGMTELMLREPLPEVQRQRAETVLRAGQHLLRLVNDTLDLARIEAGRLLLQDEPFDLPALVADVAQWLRPSAEAKGLRFSVQLAPGLPPWLRGDAARVRQILLNLGGNAIKFTEQGFVALRVAPLAGGGIEVEVEDSGIGLDAEAQQRLFQRFEQAGGAATQRRYGGTGLGLAISRQLARAMGGELLLHSRKGQGSRFTVRLPLPDAAPAGGGGAASTAPPAGMAPGTAAPSAPARALDILLVEDDPVVAEVMTGLLQSLGHRVHHAPQALAAMTLLKTQRLDLGLLDLDLPAVDGFELARLIRQGGWSLPLVAVTARADLASEHQARAAGMDGYLRKPVTGAMLAEALAGIQPRPG